MIKFLWWGKSKSLPRHRIPPITDLAWASSVRVDELARRVDGNWWARRTNEIRPRWWRRGTHSRGQFTVAELVAEQTWSPFDENGFIDTSRLKQEGWHDIGFISEDGLK